MCFAGIGYMKILGNFTMVSLGYEACTLMLAEPLSDRRDTLCVVFIKRAVKRGVYTMVFSNLHIPIVQPEVITAN